MPEGRPGTETAEPIAPALFEDTARAAAGTVRAAAEIAAAPLFRLDPGWLHLAAGLALLAATVLIPAMDDLREAEWNRDRARAVEGYRKERLDNYASYLDAVRRSDATLIVSLASTQLNLAPAGKHAMLDRAGDGLPDADVFDALDPELARAAPHPAPVSLLQRWANDGRARVWLIGAGAMAVLIGLLPVSKQRKSLSELAPA